MDTYVTRCDFYNGRRKNEDFYSVHSFESMFALPASTQHSYVIAIMLKRAVAFARLETR